MQLATDITGNRHVCWHLGVWCRQYFAQLPRLAGGLHCLALSPGEELKKWESLDALVGGATPTAIARRARPAALSLEVTVRKNQLAALCFTTMTVWKSAISNMRITPEDAHFGKA